MFEDSADVVDGGFGESRIPALIKEQVLAALPE
jgi:hypothetical protein